MQEVAIPVVSISFISIIKAIAVLLVLVIKTERFKKLFAVSVISPENWGQWEKQFQQNSSLHEKQLTNTYKK